MMKKLRPKPPKEIGGHSVPAMGRMVENLKQSGLKVTEARISVLKALSKGHGPYSAEDLHQKMDEAACDLATIYRTLISLEKAGLINRCEFGDGTARYELVHGASHHHHHVICRKCKKVEVLDDCELQDLNQFAIRKGFREVTHSLEFFGVCPECNRSDG